MNIMSMSYADQYVMAAEDPASASCMDISYMIPDSTTGNDGHSMSMDQETSLPMPSTSCITVYEIIFHRHWSKRMGHGS